MPIVWHKKKHLEREKRMESDKTRHLPIALRIYAGVIVFFNPRWVVEIKTGTRPATILRHNKFRRYNQRVAIVHTLINAYHIPIRWWIECCNPASNSIRFSMAATWRLHRCPETDGGEHIIECPRKHKLVEEKEGRKIEFSYLDVEQVEHRDGTILWQKKR